MRNNDMEKIRSKHKHRLTPIRAIKLYCKEMCCAGDQISWKDCTFTSCFLYRYRLGHRDSNLHKLKQQTRIKLSKNKQSNTTTNPIIQKSL